MSEPNPFGVPNSALGKGPDQIHGWDFDANSRRPEEAGINRSILSKASEKEVFGQKLTDLTEEGLISRVVHSAWDHRMEIVFGGGAGFAAKTATRAALVGSGGIVAAVAISAIGGFVSGGVKEYIKQRRTIDIGETEKALIIGGLKNEFRRMQASKKRDIAYAGAKGAVAGCIGAFIGAEVVPWLGEIIVKNETLQGVLVPAGTKFHETWSGLGKLIQEHDSNVIQTPAVAVTSSSFPNAPAMPEPPVIVQPPAEIQPAMPEPPVIVQPPAEVLTVMPEPPVAPEIKPLPESIKLPSGSNPWNEMQKYLTDNLGRQPTPQEIANAANQVVTDSGFPDANNIPAGATLKLTGVNEYLEHVLPEKPPVPTVTPDLQDVPKSIDHVIALNGAEVSGSVADGDLTYNGKPWEILDNGTKNIDHLLRIAGETGAVDKSALAGKLQEATNLWAHGQLNPGANEDLYRVFHLSNGTSSIFDSLVNDDDTLESLIKLGIVRK